jgi:hypothetical protein
MMPSPPAPGGGSDVSRGAGEGLGRDTPGTPARR